MPPLLADFSHARACKPFCEKYLTLPAFPVLYPVYHKIREMTDKLQRGVIELTPRCVLNVKHI